ncbi:SNF2 family N-terminal domain-containing protein [Mucor lusitanicus]|uniref:SNF2 family N-terminal domain-containing protein n=2 Tax=Mucor circinelloides f. lusitanicus TaxID=29924 RepID=A0A8H4BFB2_MUCCL|nr:SNF2 family N-terminal domain-containing protein [Mucor lusitanicus]
MSNNSNSSSTPNAPAAAAATASNVASDLTLNSLTKEKLNIVLQRAKQLQAAGEQEDGKNEFSQLMNLLRLLQQQQSQALQLQAKLQQQQQQQQASTSTPPPPPPPAAAAAATTATPAANVNTANRQLTPAELQQQQQLQIQLLQQHLLQQQMANNNGTPSPSASNASTPTGATNNNLQYQMLAYNLLSQNLASNQSSTANSPATTAATVPNTASPVTIQPQPAAAVPAQPIKVEAPPAPPVVEEVPKTMAERLVEAIYLQANELNALRQKVNNASVVPVFPPPIVTTKGGDTGILTAFDLLSGQQRSHAHASRQQRLLLPDTAPQGISANIILQEREKRIEQRAEQKLIDLEAMMEEDKDQRGQPLGYLLNEYYDDTVRTASPERLQSIVQLKSLQLRDKQQKLREEIVKNMEEANRLANSVDRTAYRKIMKQTLREARLTEKLEKQQRIDREKKEKQRHLDYLQSVCNQGRDLIAWHKSHQAKMGKLGKAILQFHAHIDKEEQRRSDKRSKDRIRALRNDDEEAYMKLIDEAKDTRLTLLLKQTGTYLESLTKAVVDQQTENMNFEADENDEEVDEEMILTDSHGNKVDYFRMAHRIQETVSQPSIMTGGTLKEYQIKGLQWMVSLYNNRLNGILADEMGLGKTIQTISLVTYLIEKKQQNGPYLIIVPLSTLTNWSLEFEKWAPSVSMICYKGTPDIRKNIQKKQIKHRDFQVLLTTFDYIIKDRPVLSKIKWQYMIIDEGHRLKNTQSKLNMVLRQYYYARYRLILTGTPLQNNLPELWALLNFTLPKIFNSVKSFEEWFNTPFSNQGVQDKVELNEEEQLLIIKRLHKVLRPFLLRRLKKDVESELPDKVETVIKCKLSALQARLYSQMKKYGVLFGSNSNNGKTSIKGLNNAIMQLRKICNHPFVFEEVERVINPYKVSNELLYRVSGKFDLLDRILPKLRATGHRVLIFFQMTQIMDIMEDFCIYRGYRHLRLDGSTKSDDRSNLLQVFNAPDSPYFMFLLSTRAGGLGLNLQTADTVIIFDSDWNPHQDLQAQDRAHRIGQTKEVRIFRLITEDSVEENILARAQYKLDIDGKVIQAGKFDHRSTEEDREAFLRSLLEDKGGSSDEPNEAEEESDELDDEELNTILKRSDQEFAIFTKMDLERQRVDAEEWRCKYGDNGKKPERLIQDWELPDIYRYDQMAEHTKKQETSVMGRGQRSRDSVRYDDGMTEKQWLRQFEDKNEASSSSVDPDDRAAKRTKYNN